MVSLTGNHGEDFGWKSRTGLERADLVGRQHPSHGAKRRLLTAVSEVMVARGGRAMLE